MPQNPKRPERPPRESDQPAASPPATRSRAGRLLPDYEEPTGVAEPEDEFLDEDEDFDDLDDEPDDAPVR